MSIFQVMPIAFGTDPIEALAVLGPMLAIFLIVFFVIFLVIYVYFSLTLMKTAQRLKAENAWLAWIPVANMYLKSKMAKMHWWPVLLVFGVAFSAIPLIGVFLYFISMTVLTVFALIWDWKICEARGKPGWWALIVLAALVPLLNIITIIPVIIWQFVMWGILAWGSE